MTKPILTADRREVLEGEVVKLRCELPEEVPPLEFFFQKTKTNSAPKEKRVPEQTQNFSEVEFYVEEGDNILRFDCFGKRQVRSGWESSPKSNGTLVTVKGKLLNFSFYISLLATDKNWVAYLCVCVSVCLYVFSCRTIYKAHSDHQAFQ